jgi:hypothetical protein
MFVVTAGLATPTIVASARLSDHHRSAVIARAQVWEATDVPSMDLKTGPTGEKAFTFNETVACTYVNKTLPGKTRKFACRIGPDDEVKVKYGGDNGEVHGEVVATRLLWALGFGADRQYSVRVICRGCPQAFRGVVRGPQVSVFDPAMIERKMPGASFEPNDGWSWNELDLVDEHAGGATRAQRDALKLLAAFVQHGDNKTEQQRLICRDQPRDKATGKTSTLKGEISCEHPFMYLHDVGLTFGRANKLNRDDIGSMNLVEWSRTPVWKDTGGCVGNLPKSFTGTLVDPQISEDGRRFLADLLVQLSDEQLRGMFEAARVQLRLRNQTDIASGFATVDEWVSAFKAKRDQIVNRRCSSSRVISLSVPSADSLFSPGGGLATAAQRRARFDAMPEWRIACARASASARPCGGALAPSRRSSNPSSLDSTRTMRLPALHRPQS